VTPADRLAIDQIKADARRIGELMSRMSDKEFESVKPELQEFQDNLNAIIREAEDGNRRGSKCVSDRPGDGVS
jgi:succinate dehydrogenase/fumarate reductase flavoprotein subunit